jgi:hypothetical protein
MLSVACSCGVTFLRWVTPEQAADELVMSDFATWMSRDQYPSTPAPSPADVGATYSQSLKMAIVPTNLASAVAKAEATAAGAENGAISSWRRHT